MRGILCLFCAFPCHLREGVCRIWRIVLGKRLGVVGIVVEDLSAAEEVNCVLHEFAVVIVGRMGLPYRERGVSIISIIVDGTGDEISALTGRLGRIKHVSVKTALTKETQNAAEVD